MDIGTYADGRRVTYDEAAHELAIEGIRTTPELLVRYDNAGQIEWSRPELRGWVQEYAKTVAGEASAPPPYDATASSHVTSTQSSPSDSYTSPSFGGGAPAYVAPTFGAAAAAYGGSMTAAGGPQVGHGAPIALIGGVAIENDRVTPASTNVIGRRYAGFAVDTVIIWVLMFFIALGYGAYLAMSGTGAAALAGSQVVLGVVYYVVLFGYFILLEAYWGTTPGKAMFGLHVMTTEGGRISLLQALLRNLLLLVDLLFFTIPAMISMKNSELHQRVGDLGAKTVVARRF